MKIEIEMNENKEFVVRRPDGQWRGGKRYALLGLIDWAFDLNPGESLPSKKSPKLKQTKKISSRGKK